MPRPNAIRRTVAPIEQSGPSRLGTWIGGLCRRKEAKAYPPLLRHTFYLRGLKTVTGDVSGFCPSFEGSRCMPLRYVASRLGGLYCRQGIRFHMEQNIMQCKTESEACGLLHILEQLRQYLTECVAGHAGSGSVEHAHKESMTSSSDATESGGAR